MLAGGRDRCPRPAEPDVVDAASEEGGDGPLLPLGVDLVRGTVGKTLPLAVRSRGAGEGAARGDGTQRPEETEVRRCGWCGEGAGESEAGSERAGERKGSAEGLAGVESLAFFGCLTSGKWFFAVAYGWLLPLYTLVPSNDRRVGNTACEGGKAVGSAPCERLRELRRGLSLEVDGSVGVVASSASASTSSSTGAVVRAPAAAVPVDGLAKDVEASAPSSVRKSASPPACEFCRDNLSTEEPRRDLSGTHFSSSSGRRLWPRAWQLSLLLLRVHVDS